MRQDRRERHGHGEPVDPGPADEQARADPGATLCGANRSLTSLADQQLERESPTEFALEREREPEACQ